MSVNDIHVTSRPLLSVPGPVLQAWLPAHLGFCGAFALQSIPIATKQSLLTSLAQLKGHLFPETHLLSSLLNSRVLQASLSASVLACLVLCLFLLPLTHSPNSAKYQN